MLPTMPRTIVVRSVSGILVASVVRKYQMLIELEVDTNQTLSNCHKMMIQHNI